MSDSTTNPASTSRHARRRRYRGSLLPSWRHQPFLFQSLTDSIVLYDPFFHFFFEIFIYYGMFVRILVSWMNKNGITSFFFKRIHVFWLALVLVFGEHSVHKHGVRMFKKRLNDQRSESEGLELADNFWDSQPKIWECKGCPPPPQCLKPQELAGLMKGLLTTIGLEGGGIGWGYPSIPHEICSISEVTEPSKCWPSMSWHLPCISQWLTKIIYKH